MGALLVPPNMEDVKPHMVKQTITYSDGTETVINYRGKVVNGVLVSDVVPQEEVVEESVEETVELPEVEITEEVTTDGQPPVGGEGDKSMDVPPSNPVSE